MANRSYLYATDSYPDTKNFSAKGMSEFSYLVHPLYELMIGHDAEIVDSQIWEQGKIALAGDLQKGKILLISFLEMLYELEEEFQTEDFAGFIADTKNFLQEREEKYVWLEAAEIFALQDEDEENEEEVSDLEVHAITLQGSCKAYVTEVKGLVQKFNEGSLDKAGLLNSEFYRDFIDIITEYKQLDIDEVDWSDFWTDILYYELEKRN